MSKNPCWAILWLILLFPAYFVAGLCSGIWIFLQPFEACFGCIADANGCLEQVRTTLDLCLQATMF